MLNIKIKLTLLLFITCFLLGNQCYAQKLMVSSEVVSYDDQQRTCISVQVEPAPKKVKKEVEDWFDDKKDVNIKGIGFLTNKDVLYAKKISIPEVSSNKMDLYVKVVPSDWGSQICVFVSFGYNIHITPEVYPREYRALKNMTIDFLGDFLTDFYKNKVDKSEEVINDLARERGIMHEQIVDNNKEIAELLMENERLAEEIKKKKAALEATEKRLRAQEAKLKQVDKKLNIENKN